MKMNISIAIADENKNYLERLVEVLQEYEELSVSIFTSAELLTQALQSRRFDIVLFDPDICENKLTFYNVRLSMCLYSEDAQNAMMYADCDKIFKYQRISKIYKELMKAYADKAGYMFDFDNSQNTKVVAVYSPIGGSGKTTIALAIAYKLATCGQEVLFLNMEQLDSTSCINAHTGEAEGITALLEAISGNTNFELKLKGLAKKDLKGVSYIEGFGRLVDYNIVTAQEVGELIDKIRKSGCCDIFIIDMESRLDNVGQVIFEKADNVIVVEKSGDIATKKVDMFAQQALVCEHKRKMSKISNFMDSSTKIENQLKIPNIGKVHNYGNQVFKDVVQMISLKEVIELVGIMK